jgi:hypothetical protein
MQRARDLFILGAGFSKAISHEMPLLGELKGLVNARHSGLLPDDADDIEKHLAYLAWEHPWLRPSQVFENRAALHRILDSLGEVISDRELSTVQCAKPAWLTRLVSWWHEQRSGVITLNYDTLVERAAVEVMADGQPIRCWNLYPPTITAGLARGATLTGSGSEDRSFRLLKLHGSVNWRCSLQQGSLCGQVYFAFPGATWQDPVSLDEGRDASTIADKELLIVPPLTEKGGYFGHETVRALWVEAGRELRRAERVYCLGYSLPESDTTMQFFLRDHAADRPAEFVVVNLDPEAPARYQRLLGGSYRVTGRFAGEDAIERFVAHLTREGESGREDAWRSA